MRRRKCMVEHVLCDFGGNRVSNFVRSVDWVGELGFLQSLVEFLVTNATVFLDFSYFKCLSNRKNRGDSNSILKQPEAFYRIVKTVVVEFVVFGFVENERNRLGFDVEHNVCWFGSDSSFRGGFKRDKSGSFNRRSGNFKVGEVLDFAEDETIKIVCKDPSRSTWMFSVEFLNEFP